MKENLKTIQEGKIKENNPKTENGENISHLFKNIQNTFIEFKQSLEKISEDTERDYFLTAKEALEYGLIDKILEKE